MKEVGFLMHADVYVYNKTAQDGTNYILGFTDDATRFTQSTRVKRKADLLAAFIKLYNNIQKARNIKIRSYRVDYEFFNNNEFKHMFDTKGISRELSVAYEHYINSISERAWRTERDKAIAMLQESNVSIKITNILDVRTTEILR